MGGGRGPNEGVPVGTQPAPRLMDRLADSCKAPAGDRGLSDLGSLHKPSEQHLSRCREPVEAEARSADFQRTQEKRKSGKHRAEWRRLRPKGSGGGEGTAGEPASGRRQRVPHGGGGFWLGWKECSLAVREEKAAGRFPPEVL